MKRHRNIWVPAVLGVLAAIILVVATRGGDGDDDAPTDADAALTLPANLADAGQLVRGDSHRLSDPEESRATFVEFLDFECEGCRAAFPAIEELRARYGDRVTFVVRYFPLGGHFNAERAARAVEAAAQQGAFEEMYVTMFETQASWGEQQQPADDTFRQFARDLGLDMTQWEADYNDPATLERIRVDQADGRALGVEATPTFFLDGEQLTPRSYDDIVAAFEAAIAK